LKKRYASDYDIAVFQSAASALDSLKKYKSIRKEVAVLLSKKDLPGINGIEFLKIEFTTWLSSERGQQAYPLQSMERRRGWTRW
jgi:hypothetical protein